MENLTTTFKLNNGVEMPWVGYGTYKTPVEETESVVSEALKIGYRHIDTAAFYQNEKGVGQAVRKSGISREEIFVTSKVWNSNRGYEKTKKAFEDTMRELDMDYLDLYLIHWPANRKQYGDKAKSINAETWRAMEELYMEGRIKAIGLSNFLPHHIDELLETAKIKPMVNQIELHPGWLQPEVVEYCHRNDIVVEAWSPLGRNTILNNETLLEIANKYDKSVAQICLRWVLQHNVVPLPKSVTPSRIKMNTEIFDFILDEKDMKVIDSLHDIGGRCAQPDEEIFE